MGRAVLLAAGQVDGLTCWLCCAVAPPPWENVQVGLRDCIVRSCAQLSPRCSWEMPHARRPFHCERVYQPSAGIAGRGFGGTNMN